MRVKARPPVYTETARLITAGCSRGSWTIIGLAQEVGVDRRTVRRWRQGLSLPGKDALVVLERLGVLPRGTWLRLIRIQSGLPSTPRQEERCTGLLL